MNNRLLFKTITALTLLLISCNFTYAQHVVTRKPTTTKPISNKKATPQKQGDASRKRTQSKPKQTEHFDNYSTAAVSDMTISVNGVSFVMKGVQGGTFTMGATAEQGSNAWEDEYPTHRVAISSFHIGQTEVTQRLWQAVMGSNPSNVKGDNLPVTNVNWNECQEFIEKLNALTGKQFRLPTEAEWEYAARGGRKSQGNKYAGGKYIEDVAWYAGNGNNRPHNVGTKKPNELGIYDMTGNAAEWTQDWYSKYTSEPQTDPRGEYTYKGRVHRGGGYGSDAFTARVSYRLQNDVFHRYKDLGLRLAL